MTEGPSVVERPVPSNAVPGWGSDHIAEVIRALDIPYIALNPGASFRGLHDSLVNYLGNETPQMLLCLHEETAVAIAHGWAKVTGRAMLALVHSNVGLMHASMAMFNAYADRVPMVVLGATGPVDPAKRRPWVDWIHTSKDQGALVRDFVKWDDQPPSIAAVAGSLLRARQIAETRPSGPTYVCFDAAVQEAPLDGSPPPVPDAARYAAPRSGVAEADIARIADMLRRAERPAIAIGKVSRSEAAWEARVRLAEALGAVVVTDRKQAAGFPTWHALNASAPAVAGGRGVAEGIAGADLVLSLNWVDLSSLLTSAPDAEVVHVSLENAMAKGRNQDLWGLAPADVNLFADPDEAVIALAAALADHAPAGWPGRPATCRAAEPEPPEAGTLTTKHLASVLRRRFAERAVTLIRTPIAWNEHMWDVRHPLDYLGLDGGGGLGSAPGMAIGASLALAGTGRFPLTVFGDGEFMMGATAVWTGVRYKVPCLMIVTNNRSYYNDELHQERVARDRGRPEANKGIGQQIVGPDLDIAMLARSQGAAGIGPVTCAEDLEAALDEAIGLVDAGGFVVMDCVVDPGYDTVARPTVIERG